jgi:alpha-L-fucosidase
LIEELCDCRRYGANFLLNVGPKANGHLRALDKAMLEELGNWVEVHKEALYLPRPCEVKEVLNKPRDFVLKADNTYYLFCYDLPMSADLNVQSLTNAHYLDEFVFDKKVKSISWLDDKKATISCEQKDEKLLVHTSSFRYGAHYVVRVAKIEVEE